ncbi:hypothetical protein BEL01nite_69250 [Bradyrhizobium elkanii]|nr:hypothetical protein BEL01nite_69250 [Bradyrhizobium elkanii]
MQVLGRRHEEVQIVDSTGACHSPPFLDHFAAWIDGKHVPYGLRQGKADLSRAGTKIEYTSTRGEAAKPDQRSEDILRIRYGVPRVVGRSTTEYLTRCKHDCLRTSAQVPVYSAALWAIGQQPAGRGPKC